jgi:hypothetical protein
VLVEKPVASTAEQAAEMVDLAAVGNASASRPCRTVRSALARFAPS